MLTDPARKGLSQLLFPNTKNTEEYIKQYPKRNLPEVQKLLDLLLVLLVLYIWRDIYSMISRELLNKQMVFSY
jgi:hypothetical protein